MSRQFDRLCESATPSAKGARTERIRETTRKSTAHRPTTTVISTLHSLHLCVVIGTVRICEIDTDDVPWKDDLITEKMEFDNGDALVPDRPGWGADLNEEVARAHVWETGRLPSYWSGSSDKKRVPVQ